MIAGDSCVFDLLDYQSTCCSLLKSESTVAVLRRGNATSASSFQVEGRMKQKCQEEKQRMVSRLYFLVSLLLAKRRKWVK